MPRSLRRPARCSPGLKEGGGLFFRYSFNSRGCPPHLSKVCTAHQSIPLVVHNALSTLATDACHRILPPPAVGRNKPSVLRRMVVVLVLHELAMSQRNTLRRRFGIENSLSVIFAIVVCCLRRSALGLLRPTRAARVACAMRAHFNRGLSLVVPVVLDAWSWSSTISLGR